MRPTSWSRSQSLTSCAHPWVEQAETHHLLFYQLFSQWIWISLFPLSCLLPISVEDNLKKNGTSESGVTAQKNNLVSAVADEPCNARPSKLALWVYSHGWMSTLEMWRVNCHLHQTKPVAVILIYWQHPAMTNPLWRNFPSSAFRTKSQNEVPFLELPKFPCNTL